MLLILCVVLSTAASYSLKVAALANENRESLIGILANSSTFLGGVLYAATFAAYAIALQKVPLSLAQPVVTAGASVLTALLSVWLLKENMQLSNWAGLLLIIAGIYLLFVGRA